MDGSGIDLVRRHDLEILENGVYAEDRNGKANSAIHFSYSYALVPPDVYFDPATGGFTVMVWFKLSSLENWQRLIDFGTEQDGGGDNIFVSKSINNQLRFEMKNNALLTLQKDFFVISTGIWFHLTVSLSNTLSKVTFYLDGSNEVSYSLPGKNQYSLVNNYF